MNVLRSHHERCGDALFAVLSAERCEEGDELQVHVVQNGHRIDIRHLLVVIGHHGAADDVKGMDVRSMLPEQFFDHGRYLCSNDRIHPRKIEIVHSGDIIA